MNSAARARGGLISQVRRVPVLYGLAWALFWAVIGTIVIGLWAHYDNLSPYVVVVSVYAVHCIAIGIGGGTAGRYATLRGWFYGGLVGFVYSLIMVLIGLTVYNTFSLDGPGILRICILTLVGAFSGMIGVNLPSSGRFG